MIHNNVTELIGGTPMLMLERFTAAHSLDAKIAAKLEYLNPAGSVKDRAALYMLDDYEKRGLISKGSVIIEPTSGNTGIGLAAIGAARGYRIILTMPETMSVERRKLLAAYGAELVLTDGSLGMNGAIAKAEELKKQYRGSVIAGQFVNPANPLAHYSTTAPEILADTNGEIDIFVAGIGSGGTISGIGRFFRDNKPTVKIIGIEPSGSPAITKGTSGAHKIQGIGAGFIPENLKLDYVDEVITIDDGDAIASAKELAKTEGILVGISSGAALAGARILAQRAENAGKLIVPLFPDTGDRYLSTELFD